MVLVGDDVDGGKLWSACKCCKDRAGARSKASMIGSGCPYCLTMLSDGTKAKGVEDEVETLDVVEILERSLVRKR